MKGNFDATLEKYKSDFTKKTLPDIVKTAAPKQIVVFANDLVGKFEEWTKSIRNINIEHSIDYLGVKRVLERYVNVRLEDIARKIAK